MVIRPTWAETMKSCTLLLTFLFAFGPLFGQITFQKTYGSNGGLSVVQTLDEGYIVSGYKDSADVYLIKTNKYGDTLWTKTFDSGHLDYGSAVLQTDDGGYIIDGTQ